MFSIAQIGHLALTQDTTDEMRVMWVSSSNKIPIVKYGTEPGFFFLFVSQLGNFKCFVETVSSFFLFFF